MELEGLVANEADSGAGNPQAPVQSLELHEETEYFVTRYDVSFAPKFPSLARPEWCSIGDAEGLAIHHHVFYWRKSSTQLNSMHSFKVSYSPME